MKEVERDRISDPEADAIDRSVNGLTDEGLSDADSQLANERPNPEEQNGHVPYGDRDPLAGAVMGQNNGSATEAGGQLFAPDDKSAFSSRWDSIQSRFVDEPSQAVRDADLLVTEVVDRLTRTFAAERDVLEREWSSTSEPSTENLRQSFRKYRDFFDKLLAA